MISTVAFCPHPPALVPELSTGAAGELAPLRAACADAIGRLVGEARRLVVLGGGTPARSHSSNARGTLSGYGRPVEMGLGAADGDDTPELPLAVTIGAWLIGQVLGPESGAVGFSVGSDPAETGPAAELLDLVLAADVALLVMGDGSARRSRSAPGYLDPRSAAFDAGVLTALRGGEPGALAALDPDLGRAVLAAGAAAWRAAGRLLAGVTFDADVLYADDPYGVGYFVAVWDVRA